ncbi:MAG: tetratricopeptide repeat-containing sensor histidine kinase [Bacteroidales bacterium]|nr:tetratricopeptide repeat-containing sensor histidine kinase [Bacteroidales bacterium]
MNGFIYFPKVLIIILFAIHCNTFGNEPDNIRMIKANLDHSTGSERLRNLKTLARFYSDTLSEIALGYANQYLKMAESENSKIDQATAHIIFASIHKYQIEFEICLDHNLKALKIFSELQDSAKIALTYYSISENFIFLRKPDSALYYNNLGHQYFARKNNVVGIFNSKLQLGKAFCFKDENEKALRTLNEAEAIAKTLNDPNRMAWVNYWIGYTSMKLGNFKEAETSLLESLENYSKCNNQSGVLGTEQELGELYLKMGQFANAYEMFYVANQKHAWVKGDKGEKNYNSQFFINIGNIYHNIYAFDRAITFFDSALLIAEENGFKNKIAVINRLKGKAWFKKGDLKKALSYFQESIEFYQSQDIKYSIAELLNNTGKVYETENNLPEAITSFLAAAKINLEIKNKFGLAKNHVNLASCFYKTGDFALMKNALDTCFQYANHLGNDEILLRCYQLSLKHCEINGEHENTNRFLTQYLNLSEKYHTETKKNYAIVLANLYQNELTEAFNTHRQEIELKNLKAEHDDLKIKQLILVILLVFIILTVFGYFLVNRINIAKKLEQQVEERTKALQEKEQKLISTNQTRDKFYSIIAHDLKSPFNSLIGFSNLLNDEYNDFSDEERKQFIAIIRNSSEEIFALLENLLDWSRKNSDKINFKPIKIDLQQIVRQTIQLQEKNAEQKKINIQNNIPKNTFVFADENMLRTIVRNLTSNAIKFSDENGTVRFETKTTNGLVKCTVADNGIGMSEKTIEKLFDLQTKVKKKGTANEKGTGLGLLLCKDFVERNGGTLEVESKEGVGTTFTFILPVK